MRQVTLHEHGVLWPVPDGEAVPDGSPWERFVPARWFHQLRRIDLRRGEERRALRWEHDRARAMQWVGVVQLGDTTLELLPKVERGGDDDDDARIRSNLLWFLALAGAVPCRERDLARLRTRSAALLETLAALFAQRLLDELLQGPSRAYVSREENLRRFKGRLVVPAHVARNAAHRERFVCRYDELSEDTELNRVLRCACAVLSRRTRRPETQDALLRCQEEFDAVTPVVAPVAQRLAARISIDRQNERYRDLFTFARLVLDEESPEPRAGSTGTFSLLFDMNVVFEGFVAGFLDRHVLPTMEGWHLAAQAKGQRRWLLGHEREGATGGLLLLKPDLLLTAPDGRRIVIDTKWKAVHPRGASNRRRPPDADFYQLHAYAHRYGGALNFLLHPQAREPVREDYRALDHTDVRTHRIAVRTVNLHRDFSKGAEREALLKELRAMLLGEGDEERAA